MDCNDCRRLLSQNLPLHRRPASLVVVVQDPSLPQLLLQHVDFRPPEVDDLLLLLVDLAGENHQQNPPGMKDKTYD
jgi:hypothetical protein